MSDWISRGLVEDVDIAAGGVDHVLPRFEDHVRKVE